MIHEKQFFRTAFSYFIHQCHVVVETITHFYASEIELAFGTANCCISSLTIFRTILFFCEDWEVAHLIQFNII